MDALFYSNGMDVFGPVSYEEFSKNRYYKSTLIWYEGLSGWIRIGDCKELKHLIGSLISPGVKEELSVSISDIAPPLSTRTKIRKELNGNYTIVIVGLSLLLVVLTYFALKQSANTEDNLMGWNNDGKALSIGVPFQDKMNSKESLALNKVRSEAIMKTYRMNWEKFITAIPDYKTKGLGGIDDVKVTVKNNSPYTLDSVKVKVIYMKANGDFYQTEYLRFIDVQSGKNISLYAPNSDRGVKVVCSIQSTYSNAMQFCYNNQIKHISIAGNDPYFCRP